MAKLPDLSVFDGALSHARGHFTAVVENAERVLEAHRLEYSQTIDGSAGIVANLESSLELFEALENERLARQTRGELQTAIEHHQATVDAATRKLHGAFLHYLQGLSSAIVGMEASFNATIACHGGSALTA